METKFKAKFITCENMESHGVKHGFFTRNGGVSMGTYKSLNCGPGSGDNPENVARNREIAMQSLGFADANNLYTLFQVHSNKVVIVNKIHYEKYEADAIVTATPGIALGILTADCTPVLFSDKASGVIGAAHAGWKGAMNGIIENTIDSMEKLGANRGYIQAAIGPTIAQDSYEVGSEFYEKFVEDNQANSHLFIASEKSGHYMFNLPLYVTHRLKASGIKSVENTELDTCALQEDFFSYRRNCLENIKDYGRNLSVIAME